MSVSLFLLLHDSPFLKKRSGPWFRWPGCQMEGPNVISSRQGLIHT